MSNCILIQYDPYNEGEYPLKYSAVAVCPHCGDITTASVQHSMGDTDGLFRSRAGKCLTCGKKLVNDKHYYKISLWTSLPKNAINDLTAEIERYENERSRMKVFDSKSKAKAYSDQALDNPLALQIRGNHERLKAYLKNIIDLEIDGLLLAERIVALDRGKRHALWKNKQLAGKQAVSLEKTRSQLLGKIERAKQDFEKTNWLSFVEVEAFQEPQKPQLIPIKNIKQPKAPDFQTPGFFNKKKVLAENERLTLEYEAAMAEYEKALQKQESNLRINAERKRQYEVAYEEYQNNVGQAKIKAAEEAEQKKAEARLVLDDKIKELNEKLEHLNADTENALANDEASAKISAEKAKCVKLLKKIWAAQNETLSLNVLFSKYRNIFAVATIYEYLLSKRCIELEGPNGAYNLYESERRSDLAANAVCKIADLCVNQGVLHQMANETEKEVARINHDTDSFVEKILNIQYNKVLKDKKEKLQKDIEAYIENNETAFQKIEAEIKIAKKPI